MQTIDVAQRLNHEIVGITFNKQINEGLRIVKQLSIPFFLSHHDPTIGTVKDLSELIEKSKPNLIVNAVVGTAGLNISLHAIRHKIDLGLANKESLVIGGYWIMQMAKKAKCKIYPIDSEHSALYELIQSQKVNQIQQLMITASGGPFWNYNQDQLKAVTLKQAMIHPVWTMGPKICIDSATLVNKAFELIEAFHLFKMKNIIAYREQQSTIHAGILLKSNVWLFHAAYPDMKLAISLCLQRYKNKQSIIRPLTINNLNLRLEAIDLNSYPVLKIAYDVINKPETTRGVVFNLVNDLASELFQSGAIHFYQITRLITNFYWKYQHRKITSIENLMSVINKIQINLQLHWKEYL